MKKLSLWNYLLYLSLIEGMAALFFYFSTPSEGGNPLFMGYSFARVMVGGGFLIICLVLLRLTLYAFSQKPRWDLYISQLDKWLHVNPHGWVLACVLSACFLALLELFLLTFISIPPHIRPFTLWGLSVVLQTWVLLVFMYCPKIHLLQGWLSLNQSQRLIFFILAGTALFLFIIFIPKNMQGVQDRHDLYMNGGDENITYPYIEWMLNFTGKPEAWIYKLLIYEDYHYGYPFYFLSALSVLPVRIIFGPQFGDQTLINMLILRQMISSLPVLLASLILVWIFTRFKSLWQSVLLFLLIVTIPNAAFNNVRFWHPDGLVVLFVVLTFYFLQKDRYQLSWGFYAAAIACGIASAIKLYGFFFALTIPLYLIISMKQGQNTRKKVLLSGSLFVITMVITIILSNPFLGVPAARQRMIEIQTFKTVEISSGYQQPDPENVYKIGWDAWIPFLEKGFAPAPFLIFLAVSAVVGSFLGKNKLLNALIFSWVALNAFYLIGFSAVKSQHYWMPALVPLFGTALNFWDILKGDNCISNRIPNWLQKTLMILGFGLVLYILGTNLYNIRSLFYIQS